jgi:hypothetical protein
MQNIEENISACTVTSSLMLNHTEKEAARLGLATTIADDVSALLDKDNAANSIIMLGGWKGSSSTIF